MTSLFRNVARLKTTRVIHAARAYRSSGPFRQALSERGLLWAVGLSRRQNAYPADVALIFPVAKAGKPRK